MGNATKKSIFDHSFPEKRLLHCQLLSEPKNLQSLFIFLGYVSLERVFFLSWTKNTFYQTCYFSNLPQKTTLGNDFVWCGSDGKVYVYVYGRRKGSKNSMENLRGRGMYLGAPRTDVQRLCSIGIRWQESTPVVFLDKWRPGLFFFYPGQCWLVNRWIGETP